MDEGQPVRCETTHTLPSHALLLTSAAQRAQPQPTDGLTKPADARAVTGHPEVARMPAHHRSQVTSLFCDGLVHAPTQFLLNHQQLGSHALGAGQPQDRELPFAGLPAAVRESSPVESHPPPSRVQAHDSGPPWLARPSTYDSFIHTTLPVLTGAQKPSMPGPMSIELVNQYGTRAVRVAIDKATAMLGAGDIDAVIQHLSYLRAAMRPEVPKTPSPAHQFFLEMDPCWHSENAPLG